MKDLDRPLSEESMRPPGPDARDLVPDVEREAFKAIKDSIRGERPRSVLGVLIDRRRPMEVVTIAGLIGEKPNQVNWIAEVLEEEGLCRCYDDEGVAMVELVTTQEPTPTVA